MKPLLRTPLLGLTGLLLSAAVTHAAEVFSDDFELPDVDGYNITNTSGQASSSWVRSSTGYGASRNGVVDATYEGTWAAPGGNQAYAFRYTNSGVTSSFGSIGSLAAGAVITVSFDVFIDGFNGGTPYKLALVTFDGAGTRNDTDGGGLIQNTSSYLAETSGDAPGTGFTTVILSYTVGDDVLDSNGATAGGGTTFDPAVIGQDIGIRFQGASSSASIDNVSVDLVVPPDTAPPEPNPMTFDVAPAAISATEISMTATTAIDSTPPVEYLFENTTNATDSGWISSTTWTDTGLTQGLTYDYQVTARDSLGNTGNPSAIASALADFDSTAPEPNPMTFAVAPQPTVAGTIEMTATTATDAYGSDPVEYYFVRDGSAADSGWILSPTWEDTGLTEGVTYNYQVKARDAEGNETAFSAAVNGTVEDLVAPSTPGFADGPKPASATSVTMTATTSTDAYPSNPVEYWFENTTLVTNSGWSTSKTWTEIGLTEGVEYTYQVKARDAVGNETGFSGTASAIPVPDTAAPTPNPMTFAVAPAPTANGTISMRASLATDAYGSNPVEYWFENTTNSDNSGWITSRSWSNSGLTEGVSYDYQVKARDAVGLETAFSATASATAKNFAVALSENFEAPDVDAYTIGNTSGQVPPNWVKSSAGYNSSRSGLVDDVYETTGWSDTDGQQAWAGRYSSNTGISTAEGVIGALAAGQTIVVNFNSMIDTQNAGSDINVYLVTYSAGAAGRNDFTAAAQGAYDILYRFTGTATGTETGYSFSYTAGDNTYAGESNGAAAFDPANVGKDIALRFEHKNDALVDNVQVLLSTGGGGPGIPYDDWADGPWAGTLTDPDPALDFDLGGLSTGIEWVVGGDPTDGSDDASVTPVLDNTTDPDFLIFTYRRSDAALADTNTAIEVEYGTDLSGWTTAVAGADILINATDDGAAVGVDLVEVKIRRSAFAVGGKLFARLNVVVTAP